MSGTRPAKPWRVYGRGPVSVDHRTQRAAYEQVQTQTRLGVKSKVYHFEDGSWRLYEVIHEVATVPADSTGTEKENER